FKKTTGQMMRDLRNAKKLPGQKRIWTAGEKEFDSEKEVPRTGVPINDNLQKIMKNIKDELDIDIELPFLAKI
ncbi:MAG: Ldh family oxidoreductase, partial [Vulcanimicrobiota bacterium]